MPLSNRAYDQEIVRPYLFGLLPDSERQRRAIAKEHGVSANNPVALLSVIGLDCPGAVQFCGLQDVGMAGNRREGYRVLSDKEIALKLRSIKTDFDATWMGRDESWSLGGNQGKFALALRDGQWCECFGSAATTHIFKNGVEGFKLKALNEYVCMRVADKVGIPTARVAYRLFDGEPALVVSRCNRVASDGRMERLHQEDLCQALGIMPDQKYTSDGGPTARDILELLLSVEKSSVSLRLFTGMLFFNCLIGAPDAHAKNYLLLLMETGSILAPLYDVASWACLWPNERLRQARHVHRRRESHRACGRGGCPAFCGSQRSRVWSTTCGERPDAGDMSRRNAPTCPLHSAGNGCCVRRGP